MIFFPSFGIVIGCQSCHGNCTMSRASGWEGDCGRLCGCIQVVGVPHCLLPCSFGGAGDGVRTGVSTFLMFLTPNAEPHWFIL